MSVWLRDARAIRRLAQEIDRQAALYLSRPDKDETRRLVRGAEVEELHTIMMRCWRRWQRDNLAGRT